MLCKIARQFIEFYRSSVLPCSNVALHPQSPEAGDGAWNIAMYLMMLLVLDLNEDCRSGFF